MSEYDFHVVVGGTAGCVLAAQLTEDPAARVLLLEAGPRTPLEESTVPPIWPKLGRSELAQWQLAGFPHHLQREIRVELAEFFGMVRAVQPVPADEVDGQ